MSYVSCLLFASACALAFLSTIVPDAFAQAPAQPPTIAVTPPASDARVGTITVKFVGTANVNEQVVRANMQLTEGGPVDEALIDRDIRALYRTGQFELIEFKRDTRSGGLVDIQVELTPKFRVLRVDFTGIDKIKRKRLEREIKTRPNLALDERQVKEDAQKLKEFYQKSGYNQATVNYTIDRDRNSGFGTIVFQISEGEKVKIKRVDFTGNEHLPTKKLRKVMTTRKWNIFSWITDTGRLRDEAFDEDLEKLRDAFREEGLLDVEIDPAKIRYEYPSAKKLVITIPVVEGRQYHVGDIRITGNTLYTTDELRAVLRQTTGKIFAPSLIDKDARNLEETYGKDGYIDARVQVIRRPNLTTGAIDLEYAFREGEKYYVESIKLEGNTKTKSIVILRELNIGPGEVFNIQRMNISKLRLENTRFFEEVNMTPEATNIPGRRNLKIAVREGRTGNLTFGAGFSTLDSVILFAEVSQSNFDLFHRKSLFQGDGQKFRLRLQVGSRSNEAILSFEEPWFLERELALGFSLYRTSTDYDNQLYNEVRTGANVYLRKRLIELIEGKIGYTIEQVEMRDIDSDAPWNLKAEEGKQDVSKLTFTLLRDTRDRLINTSRGNRVEFTTTYAGGALGGDADYYGLELRASQYIPTFETLNQVLSVIGRVGVIDGDYVPYFDQYFLGGPSTLRGFEYRQVGPKQGDGIYDHTPSGTDGNGEPMGGKSYGMLSIEYTFDIVEPLRFAVFYDAGFVNRDAYDFDPSHYNDNFGFGIRIMIMGAPLSLDYGIPITSDRFNDSGGQFNFSFGTRF
ncbi:outer membrane protein assembly complex, YaeT protein [Opitutaceae bacterium TAV1]|nr:outer membrane protein assembly complex, YaeT protein [Opitutaceae bacterium TAV1]